MTKELIHKSPGTSLTQAEFEATDGHQVVDQATDDILVATSATQLSGVNIGEQEIVGRITGGHVDGLTPTQVRTLINVADGANAYVHPNHSGEVTSAADGAQTIANNAVTLAKLATQAADTVLANATSGAAVPTAVALTASTILGKKATGNIAALTPAEANVILGPPMVARVYAADAPLKPSATDAANLIWLCDGTADEEQINAAIAVVHATGKPGRIQLSEGTFSVSSASINFLTYEDITLQGQGTPLGYDPSNTVHAVTVIKQANGANLDAIITNDKTQDAIYYGIVIRDLGIDGNKANQTGGDGHGINLNAAQWLIQDVAIGYCRGTGIYLDHDDSGSDNAAGGNIINGSSRYNAGGLEIGRFVTDIRITGWVAGGNTSFTEKLHSGSMIQHNNCTLWGSNFGTNVIVIKPDLGPLSYIFYTGCIIDGSKQHLIIMDVSDDANSIADVQFTGCLLNKPGIDADNTYDFVNFVSASTKYIYCPAFIGCKFLRNSGSAAPRYFFNWTARVVDPIVVDCFMDSAISATALDNGVLPLRLLQGNNKGLIWPGQTFKMVCWLTHVTKAVSFDSLPAGYSLEVTIVLVEAFNSDGTDNIYVGYSGNAGAYAGPLDGSGALGVYTTLGGTIPRGTLCGYNNGDHTVRAEYFDGGTDATQGKALIEITATWVGVSP